MALTTMTTWFPSCWARIAREAYTAVTRAVLLDALTATDQELLARDACQQRLDQRRLPDPGLAGDEHDRASTLPGPPERLPQPTKLGVPLQ